MKIKQKLFVVRKYIWAKSAAHALKLEQKVPSDDVWIDDDWKKSQQNPKNAIGYNTKDHE